MTMPRGRTSRDDNNDGGRGDYMNLALGGKVVGDVLRNLGKAANPSISVVSGLVGKLASHRRKVKTASTGMQRTTPKQPGTSGNVTSATSSRDAAKMLKPKKVTTPGSGIGTAQTAGQKRKIIEGVNEDDPFK